MQEPPHGYSIAELHAYAKSRDYQDEADALRRYLEMRQRKAPRRNQNVAPQSGLDPRR